MTGPVQGAVQTAQREAEGLRLNGWADACKDVFAEIETLEGAAGEARQKDMSDQFWTDNAYDEG